MVASEDAKIDLDLFSDHVQEHRGVQINGFYFLISRGLISTASFCVSVSTKTHNPHGGSVSITHLLFPNKEQILPL